MPATKKALITGLTGQDGSYLAEQLFEKGYEVYGILRRASQFNRGNIEHVYDTDEKRRKYLYYGDMTDLSSVMHVLQEVQPDEIYNLAAQSHVKVSFEIPCYTAQSDAIGVLHVLEAVRMLGLNTKIYQASTSEMFSGDPETAPQNENTPFTPRSPYGAAKSYAAQIARIYRESYDMFVVNGILFNHESPRRGLSFVSRKIAKSVADIKAGTKDTIHLGNLEACRDWGYAPEYMEAAWQMLQEDSPEDFVIATGETRSVREFTEHAFKAAGIEIVWEGSGVDEVGKDAQTGNTLVEIDQTYFRPNEVNYLCGDYSKAHEKLGWKPTTKFEELVQIMVDAELENV